MGAAIMTPAWSWADVKWVVPPAIKLPPKPKRRPRKPPTAPAPDLPTAPPKRRGRPPKSAARPIASSPVLRPQPAPVQPFPTAASAWFWACSSPERTYLDRPCRPSAIHAALDRLRRNRLVDREQVRVLGVWGRLGFAPSPGRGCERRAWDEAMAVLGRALRVSGVVG